MSLLSDNPCNLSLSKYDNVYKHKTSFSKIDNNYWSPGAVATVGVLIVNDIDKKRLSLNNRHL